MFHSRERRGMQWQTKYESHIKKKRVHVTDATRVWIWMNIYNLKWLCSTREEKVDVCFYMWILLSKRWNYFFRRRRLLRLPEVVVNCHRVDAGRHGLGWYLAELLLVWVVLVEAVDHLACDALWADACQLDDLLRLGAVGVERAELAASITEQHQEVVGLGFLHFLWIRDAAMKLWDSGCVKPLWLTR